MAILPHFYSRQNPRPWAVCIPLLVLAGIYAVAGIAWLTINPEQRVEAAT
jgi:hypothetical protein